MTEQTEETDVAANRHEPPAGPAPDPIPRDTSSHADAGPPEGQRATESSWGERAAIAQGELLTLVATGRPLTECLEAITASVSKLHPGTHACVLVANEARDRFVAAYAAEVPASFCTAVEGVPIEELGIGTCARAIHRGQPVTCTDIAADPRWAPVWRELCVDHGILACHSEPAIGPSGHCVASLMLCFAEARAPDARELRIGRFAASIAAIAIERQLASERQALRRAEARSRAFVTASSDVVYRMSADWTQMRQLDGQGFLADTPEPSEDWIGAYIHPDDQAKVRAAIELAVQTKTMFELEHRVQRADGALGWTLSRAIPILDEHGGITEWLVAASDVTERKVAEEQLRASEEFSRRVLESSADCINVLDEEARIEFMSEGGMCVMEVEDFGAIQGASWSDFWQSEEHAKALAAIEEAKRGGTGRFQGSAPTMKGTPRWWDVIVTPISGADGRPEKLLSVSRDITASKQVEAALSESERELQTLADTLPVLVAYIDTERRYRFTNRTYERWFPERRHAIQGALVRDVVGEEAYARVERWMDRALAGESVSFETLLRYRDGPARHVRVEFVPRFADGAVQGLYALVHDISEQKHAEGALRASAAQLAAIFAQAAVGLSQLTLDGHLLRVNDELCRILARRRDEVLAGSIADVTHPDDVGTSLANFRAVVEKGTTISFDKRYIRADGTVVWANSNLTRLNDEHGQPSSVLAATIDLTDRKLAEDALRESEEQLRLATEAAEVGLWDWHVATDTLFWPARVKAMFGISADVSISMANYYAGLHPDDAEATAAAFATAIDPRQRALYDVEYRTIGKEDSVVRWVAAKGRGQFDASGRCVRVLGTAIDITARKLTEQRLHELNATLEARVAERTEERDRTWNNARDLLLVIGTDGVFRAVNPAWNAILGWATDELVGRSYLEFIHPDDHLSSQSALAVASQEMLSAYETRYRHRDGSYRWISWVAAPEADLIYANGRDITAERVREAELEAAQEALRQAQKMEAMGQLTGGVAHDFNNLLTPIVGALDMLQHKGVGNEREQRLIAGAAQSAERARILVQRLLAFARRQPLQSTAVDVAKLAGGMADLIRSTSGPQIKVVVSAAGDLPAAEADQSQLEMALLNLSVNARDAMPEGGTLRITANEERVDAGHAAKLSAGRYVRLSVADTGLGMDEATLARAVEPFFSTKGVGKGTGLGLSMAHGLASQLGGALTIQSRPGVGTNIEIWLPVSQTAVGSAVVGGAFTPAAAAAAGTVLLVDDEELVRMSTADMLDDLGYRVVEAVSAEKALALVHGGLRPDLLVSDHLMPGMNGTDLARVIRGEQPGVKILIVSGYAESEGIAPDLPRLSKPFRKDELAACLASLRSQGLSGF